MAQPKPASNRSNIQPTGPRRSPCSVSSVAHSAGVSVIATTPESTTAMVTVTANCRYSWPAMPPRKATGMKTAHSTSTMPITAPCTSRIASIEASTGDRCSSRISRSTFSSTTIASSTTMPIASTIANSVSVLIEKPNSHSPAKVPISETGTASIGISVARHVCRNTNTTATTIAAASRMVFSTSLIEAETKRVVSYGIRKSTSGGNRSRASSAIRCRTAAATSSALAPDCRNTAIAIDGWPLMKLEAS